MTPADWLDLPLAHPFSPQGLRETLLGGQAMRWSGAGPDTYAGFWSRFHVELRLPPGGHLQFRSATPGLPPPSPPELRAYLADDVPWADTLDRLPWRRDPVLRRALDAFPGLRVLRQPPGETLLAFLCSSNKRIIQIQRMCSDLAHHFGSPLGPPTSPAPSPQPSPDLAPAPHALPSWERLATLTLADLQRCRLGYRARFVHETARFLAAHPGYLDSLQTLPYPAAHGALTVLPGVGPKVADCVLLFAFGQMEAFPLDTWILRTLQTSYGLASLTPAQLAAFARNHFAPAPGLAQQFLFSAARLAVLPSAPEPLSSGA